MYVPILKAKTAEVDALASLPPGPQDVLPLFEAQAVLPPVRNKQGNWVKRKSGPTDLAAFLDEIYLSWHGPMMLDVSRAADPQSRATWWTMVLAIEAIRPTEASIIPVVAIDDPLEVLSAAGLLATRAGRAALRVSMPANPAVLSASLPVVAAGLGLPVDRIIVVLDWCLGLEASKVTLDGAERATRAAISALPIEHGPVVTAGTADIGDAQQDGYWSFTRREWWLCFAHV